MGPGSERLGPEHEPTSGLRTRIRDPRRLGHIIPATASQYRRVSGDVWIADPRFNTSNAQLDPGFYGLQTLNHELGHSLGLSHPGDYNFGDDNDGDGMPDPITYEGDAFYYQDNQQYTIMSYFDMYEAGNNQVDWNFMRFVYPSTPMVHDIWVAQQIYGAGDEHADGQHDLWLQRDCRRDERSHALRRWRDGQHFHHLGCGRQRHARPVGLLHAVGHRPARGRLQQCRWLGLV